MDYNVTPYRTQLPRGGSPHGQEWAMPTGPHPGGPRALASWLLVCLSSRENWDSKLCTDRGGSPVGQEWAMPTGPEAREPRAMTFFCLSARENGGSKPYIGWSLCISPISNHINLFPSIYQKRGDINRGSHEKKVWGPQIMSQKLFPRAPFQIIAIYFPRFIRRGAIWAAGRHVKKISGPGPRVVAQTLYLRTPFQIIAIHLKINLGP